MLSKLSLTLLIAISLLTKVQSQNNISKDSVALDKNERYRDIIKNLPAFTMFGDNYFVTGTSTKKDAFTSEGSDTKFEIGFKQLLTNVELPLQIFPFLTYRQKAFWDTYKESLPFRELNYNPSIGFAKLFFKQNNLNYALYLSFEHESNGRDGVNSRSINSLLLIYFKPIGNNIQLIAKAWLPVGDLGDNKDILSYRGLFNIGMTYKFNDNLFFDILAQPAYDTSLQGSIKSSISFKISKKSNQFIHLQHFIGHGEDLFYYNKAVSKIRLGIVFKDLIFNFDKKNTPIK